jgi:hypothetical protein
LGLKRYTNESFEDTPDEFRERLTNDIQNSWMRLIVEGVDK